MSSVPLEVSHADTDNTVKLASVANHNSSQPLRACVKSMLETYFNDLDGHAPGELYDLVVREVEHPLLETVMVYTRGNQSKAAKLLGINRGTLRKKLKIHNLD